MQPRTKMNGGDSTLQEVADAWKKEAHPAAWSTAESEAWTVEFAKKLKDARLKAGDPVPDPRNSHGN